MVFAFLFLVLLAATIADPAGLNVVAFATAEALSEAESGVYTDTLDINGNNFTLSESNGGVNEGLNSDGGGAALVDNFGNDLNTTMTVGGGAGVGIDDESNFNSNDADSGGLADGYDESNSYENYEYGYDSYASEYYYSGDSSDYYSNGDTLDTQLMQFVNALGNFRTSP